MLDHRDPQDVGVRENWFALKLDETVQLPGTTDENHKGVKKDEQRVDRLSRVWYWKGPAWYQRRVTIRDAWKGKRITLLLERSKSTRVWVDQTFCGGEDTLSAPQWFDVTRAMTPGEHTLTVLVDNARLPPVGPSHAVDERTQTNWNGIVGRIELRAADPVWLDVVQRAEPRLDASAPAPRLEAFAPELSPLVADQMPGYGADASNRSAQKGADLLRGWLPPERCESHRSSVLCGMPMASDSSNITSTEGCHSAGSSVA